MQRSPKTAIAILISGNGSNLQALMDAVNQGLPVDIKVVISNKADAYGLIRARDAGIATEVIEHDDYTSRAAFDEALANMLDTYRVDWILLAGFMRRLDTSFVQRYSGRIINIHPSLLPKYKGLHTHEAVLAAGDAEHGASIHFVTEEVDGGPIICQARLKIQNDDTPFELKRRVQGLEHRLYPRVLSWLAKGVLNCVNDKVVWNGQFLPSKGLDQTKLIIKYQENQ